MRQPIRLFVFTSEEGEVYAYDLPWFVQFGLESEEAVQAVYAGQGRWHTIQLKPLCGAIERDIQRAARVPDPERGFVLDPAELPAARAAVAVESWDLRDVQGNPAEVSKDGYYQLPNRVAAVLDRILFERLYGTIDPFFWSYLKSRQPPSAPTAMSALPSAISTMPSPNG